MVTDHSTPTPGHEPYDLRLSRGRLLRGAAGAMLASPLIAAACGGSSSGTSAASTTAAGGPKRGGTLRVGFVSGGTAETVNPLIGVTPIDQGRIQVLFDPLVM